MWQEVYTVFRNVGPRSETSLDGFIGFDSFLLEEAKKRGAVVINGNVTDILIPQNPIVEQCKVMYQDAMNNPIELSGEHGTYATRRILFDRFMLQTAQELGATVIRSRVTDIEFNGTEDVKIYADDKFLRADVVVGAFGLDDGFTAVMEHASRQRFAYKRPPI